LGVGTRGILGVVLLAAGSFVAACGGGEGQGAQAQSICPSIIPTQLSALSTSDRSIPAHPTGAQLCSFSKRRLLPFEPTNGVRVDQSTARVVARLINSASPFHRPDRTCRPLGTDNGVMIRFTYVRAQPHEVALIYYGCPTPAVFGLSTRRAPSTDISNLVVSAANSFASKRGHATAPELIGDDIATAEHVATADGYSLGYGGEQIDSTFPFGAVLFQVPPAGLWSTFGDQIDVTIAVRPAPSCVVSSLVADYQGGGPENAALDVGGIDIRDVGLAPCLLRGPIAIEGVSATGAVVTNQVEAAVGPNLILTPATPPLPESIPGPLPAGEVWVSIQMSAGTENPNTGQSCSPQITPARWRLTIDGGTLSIENSSVDSAYPQFAGLVTCGSFSAAVARAI